VVAAVQEEAWEEHGGGADVEGAPLGRGAEEPPAVGGGAGDDGMSRNAWRKKQSRQRKAAAKAALDAARARGDGAPGTARGGGTGAGDVSSKRRRF
jgi:hypothetical protein